MSCLIEFDNISKSYHMGDNIVEALKDVNFKIHRGELTAIIGPSGSGKSTIMNILGLLDSPTAGKYYLEGKAIGSYHENELAKMRNQMIGFVFQSFFLLPRLTALQNVCLPMLYRGLSQASCSNRAMQLLERVGVSKYQHHKPHELSGGQQQRVAVARALIGEPRLVLADEPTGALDSKTSDEVMQLFNSLNQDEGVTFVIITHDPELASKCKRIIQVVDGAIINDAINENGINT